MKKYLKINRRVLGALNVHDIGIEMLKPELRMKVLYVDLPEHITALCSSTNESEKKEEKLNELSSVIVSKIEFNELLKQLS